MPKVLAVSSFVASGSVGLRAALATMAAHGIDLIAMPTVVLSAHPGHGRFAGQTIDVGTLEPMLSALEANGELADISAVLMGYLPSAAHVAFGCRVIAAVKSQSPQATIVVDPVLGDDPGGLYIDVEAAKALARDLVGQADLITPNRFELSYLTGRSISDVATASAASRMLSVPHVAATSIPLDDRRLGNVLITPDGVRLAPVTRSHHAPHGTGDLFAATLVARLVINPDLTSAFERAVAVCEHAIAVSGNKPDVALASLRWSEIIPVPSHALATAT